MAQMASSSLNYSYIGDEDLLRSFQSCNKLNTVIRVNYCIYNINNDCFIENGFYNNKDYTNIVEKHNTTQSTVMPFLQLLLQFSETECEFPHNIHSRLIVGENRRDDDDDTEDDEDTAFQTESFLYFVEILEKYISAKINKKIKIDTLIHKYRLKIEKCYKGFVEYDADNIVVFYDATDIINIILQTNIDDDDADDDDDDDEQQTSTYIFAIIDEIIFNGCVNGISVSSFITDFFVKNEKLRYIIIAGDDDGEMQQIEFPLLMHLLEDPDSEFKYTDKILLLPLTESTINNILNNATNASTNNNETRHQGGGSGGGNPATLCAELSVVKKHNGIPTPFNHPKYGYMYYFKQPPSKNESMFNLSFALSNDALTAQRYACFTNKCLYMSSSPETDKTNAEYSATSMLYASSIYFHENGIAYWGIRDVSQFVAL